METLNQLATCRADGCRFWQALYQAVSPSEEWGTHWGLVKRKGISKGEEGTQIFDIDTSSLDGYLTPDDSRCRGQANRDGSPPLRTPRAGVSSLDL